MLDLSELNMEQEDLEELGVEDPDEYQDEGDPAPAPEANYRFRVLDYDFDRDDNGKLKLDQEKYPVIVVKKVQVVEPEEVVVNGKPIKVAEREIYPYQRFSTRPRERYGKQGASPFADLLRSFDSTRAWRGEEGFALLNEFVANGATFRARGRWGAYDTKYADAEFIQAGGRANASREEQSRIFKKARINGMKKFPVNPSTGMYVPMMKGPSGENVTARFKIGRLYPSHDLKVKLG